MNRKTVMSMPAACFWSVVAACVLGIVIGSFRDFDINAALANKTELGSFFATYGSYFSYCLYPAAGACLYAGLKKKGGGKNGAAFALACVFVLAYGYNRIHMTNHFLTDVCFGTLITYLIYALISSAFLRAQPLRG